jgi:hypothetical protein
MPQINELAKGKDIAKKAGYTYIWLACPMCKYERWVKYVFAKNKDFKVLCRNGCQQKVTSIKHHSTNPMFWDGISELKVGMQTMSGRLPQFKNSYSNARFIWDECHQCHRLFWRIAQCYGRLCDHCKRILIGKTKLNEGGRKAWANPKKREIWIRNCVKGIVLKPTKIEQIIIDICKEYNLPYEYVGDGKIIIEGKNPDFINTNHIKAIIEVYGEYWHNTEDEPERIAYFAKYGYNTLILWDKEIINRPHEEIYNKIKSFTDGIK